MQPSNCEPQALPECEILIDNSHYDGQSSDQEPSCATSKSFEESQDCILSEGNDSDGNRYLDALNWNIFNQYYFNLVNLTIQSEFKPDKTYNGSLNYYFVFSPLNVHKDDFTDIKKIEKYLRNKYKYDRILITREVRSIRKHYNVVLTTKYNPLHANGQIVMKFYQDIQHIPNIGGLYKVIDYMTKESKLRAFFRGLDYFIYNKY